SVAPDHPSSWQGGAIGLWVSARIRAGSSGSTSISQHDVIQPVDALGRHHLRTSRERSFSNQLGSALADRTAARPGAKRALDPPQYPQQWVSGVRTSQVGVLIVRRSTGLREALRMIS